MFIQIKKDATFNSDRKQINLISNRSLKYYNLSTSIIFRRIRIYIDISKYFFIFHDLKVTLKTFIPVSRIFDNEDDIFIFLRNVRKSSASKILFKKRKKIMKCYIRMRRKKSINIVCKLNWLFYNLSWMLHLSEIVWTLRSSVWVVFNNFLLIVATDRNKNNSDKKRLFFAVNLDPLIFREHSL